MGCPKKEGPERGRGEKGNGGRSMFFESFLGYPSILCPLPFSPLPPLIFRLSYHIKRESRT